VAVIHSLNAESTSPCNEVLFFRASKAPETVESAQKPLGGDCRFKSRRIAGLLLIFWHFVTKASRKSFELVISMTPPRPECCSFRSWCSCEDTLKRRSCFLEAMDAREQS
jgi:hypothetical protein